MLSILSDSQKAVVDTIVMKLKLNQCLEYVEEVGYKMSERTYYRKKKQVEDMKLERMRFIAKVAYEEQHLERLDKMELIENQMWTNYWREKEPYKKVKILSEIANIQPIVSAYYDATKGLLEDREAKIKGKYEEDNNESKTIESASWGNDDEIPPVA
jgi:hypothetical protein